MNFFNLSNLSNKQTNIARISDDIGLTIIFNNFCVKHYYNYFSYFIRSRMSIKDDDLSTTNQMDNEQEKSKVEDLVTENEEKGRMEEDRSDQNSLRYDNGKSEECGNDQNSLRCNSGKSEECGMKKEEYKVQNDNEEHENANKDEIGNNEENVKKDGIMNEKKEFTKEWKNNIYDDEREDFNQNCFEDEKMQEDQIYLRNRIEDISELRNKSSTLTDGHYNGLEQFGGTENSLFKSQEEQKRENVKIEEDTSSGNLTPEFQKELENEPGTEGFIIGMCVAGFRMLRNIQGFVLSLILFLRLLIQGFRLVLISLDKPEVTEVDLCETTTISDKVQAGDDEVVCGQEDVGAEEDCSTKVDLCETITISAKVQAGDDEVICGQEDVGAEGDSSNYNVDLESTLGRMEKKIQDLESVLDLAKEEIVELKSDLQTELIKNIDLQYEVEKLEAELEDKDKFERSNYLEFKQEKLKIEQRLEQEKNDLVQSLNEQLTKEQNEKDELCQKLQEELSCPVCFSIPRSGKIPMCKNGHIFCDKCISKE